MTIIGFLLRSVFRHKLRVALTIFALTTAFILFILLRSVAVVFEVGFSGLSDTRMQTQHKYSMVQLLPYSHRYQIEAVDGVTRVTHASWFGGSFKEGETNDASFAVDPESYFDVYDQYIVDPQQLTTFKATRTGAMAPVAMVEKYGWKIGQKIPAESTIFPNPTGEPWTFDLVGIYDPGSSAFGPFIFHYEYLNELYDLDAIGWFTFTISDAGQHAEIAQTIDKKFENSADATITMTESASMRSFMSQWGDISLMVTGILGAVFFTMILLITTTLIHSFRERIPELAVLKTLGFSDARVAIYMLAEGVLICGISAVLGVGLGVIFTMGVQATLGEMVFIYLELETALWALLIALLLGIFVGAFPSIIAHRLQIVQALQVRR